MDLTPFKYITIGELLVIKRILKKPMKEALPLIREVQGKYLFDDEQIKNLCRIARDFN